MRRILFGLLVFLGCHNLYGQSWVEIPQFQMNFYANCLYTDTVDNLLYVGGQFGLNGTDSIRGVAVWDNSAITGCGEGINSFYQSFHCGVPLDNIVRFQDKIYVGGGATQFTVGDSIWTRGIGVWDGVAWDSINVPLYNNFGNPTGVLEMKLIDNNLYVGGGFTNINGTTEANGLAKFDGASWSAVHDFPQWGGTSVNVVRHIAEYNGEIYVAGQLTDAYPYDTMYNICRFNGTEWEQLGEGIGGTFSTVLGMEVYNGKLYVYGSFNKNDRPQNPGNRIAAWNGTNWEQVVVDIQGTIAEVRDVAVHNGELYVVGDFDWVNGYPANNFVKFDGINWCTYNDVFNSFVHRIEVYNNEVYISGNFSDIDGSPIVFYAKFNPSAVPANCHSVVGLEESQLEEVLIYPNPSDDLVTIQLGDGQVFNGEIIIYSTNGTVLKSFDAPTGNEITISTAKIPSGIYIIQVGSIRKKITIQ